MKTQRLLGRLAAACLFATMFAFSATAQVRTAPPRYNTARPATTAPVRRAPVYSTPASSSSQVKFGLRAGLNVADVQGDAVKSILSVNDLVSAEAISKQMRPAFFAGVYATLPLSPQFAIEPGLYYSEKGTVLSGTVRVEALSFLNAKLTGTARLSYLDVPVLAKVFVTDGFYLYAGPQASFLLSGDVRAQASALGFSAYNQNFDIKDQLRSVDFGLVGGLGYQSDFGIGINAGYDFGLNSLDKNNRFDAYNRVIKVGVNYSF